MVTLNGVPETNSVGPNLVETAGVPPQDGGGINRVTGSTKSPPKSRIPKVGRRRANPTAVDPGGAARNARNAIEQQRERAVQRLIYPPDDEEFECKYPFLWEGLTMSAYADGTPRMPWELAIRRIPGGYAGTLTDHDLLQRLPFKFAAWDELRQTLEMQLLSSSPGWEPMEKSYKNKKGLKKFDKKA